MDEKLAPYETAGIDMICGANERAREVFAAVAARQRRSVALQSRAVRAASGLPTLIPFYAAILPLCVARAEGSRIVDVDGHEYIDCHMAYTASVLGHRPPAVTRAVREALDRGLGGGQFFAEQVELAELVHELVPGLERVAFFHTGGEAVSAAVRLARAATGRFRVAKFEGCYHGANEVGLHNTMRALAERPPGGDPGDIRPQASTGGMRTAPDDFLVLPFNSGLALDRLREHAGELACVVADPVPPFLSNWPEDCRRFLSELAAVCSETGVPLIFDEVVCGFRLALGGARGWSGCAPAMSCYAKITSGLGIPMSLVAGEARFLDYVQTGGVFQDHRSGKAWLSSTLSSNFLAVVAALAQLRDLRGRYEEVMARLDRNHAELSARLADFAKREGIPVSLQGHPRLQMQLTVGLDTPLERTYRGVMSCASLAQYLSLMAMTFYLRLEGIYTQTVPTMNLSAAHTDRDIELLAEGIGRSLLRMRQDGMLAVS